MYGVARRDSRVDVLWLAVVVTLGTGKMRGPPALESDATVAPTRRASAGKTRVSRRVRASWGESTYYSDNQVVL